MSLDRTQEGIAELFAAIPTTGTATGNVPVIPVPMSSMSSPVQATINAITAQGGPTWIATLATQSYVASQIAILTDGSPDALNTFLEAYNRFLVDESAASAVNAALSTETNNRAAADAALTTAVALAATANETTATLDFGFATGNEGDGPVPDYRCANPGRAGHDLADPAW